MERVRKNLGYFNLIISFFILVFFNKELLLPKEGPISLSKEVRDAAEERTLLIEWGTATWSGIILSSELEKIQVLTIIHEDAMKKINDAKNDILKISLKSGEVYLGKIKKWNQCNELSVIEIDSTGRTPFLSKLNLETEIGYLSQPLFSFGHPLGLNIHYSEGYLSSTGNKIKPCGMVTSGFSGGTIPGQTGSGVWNERGELSGLIVATSAFPAKTFDAEGKQIGQSVIPITFLGRFIPASEIEQFLK
jgi:hypothetical protein